MADQNEPGKAVAHKRLERFVKGFEESSKQSKALVDAVQELTEALVGEEDSVSAYFDSLIESNEKLAQEIRGLRQDLRDLAKSQGIGGLFDLLRGGG